MVMENIKKDFKRKKEIEGDHLYINPESQEYRKGIQQKII